jgi:hypothetical protein
MPWMPFVTALPSRLETRRAFKAQIAAALPILRPFQRQFQRESAENRPVRTGLPMHTERHCLRLLKRV